LPDWFVHGDGQTVQQAITGIILKRMASKHRIGLSRVAVGFENGLLAESYPDEKKKSHLQLRGMCMTSQARAADCYK